MKKSLAALFIAGVAAAQPVRVEIDATHQGPAINPLLYGINTARWDESIFPHPSDHMLLSADRDAITKVKASGITLLKYPGGNDADSYIWNSPDNSPSEMDTDEYIAFCRAVGAEPFITINFNAAPELAAEWVRYCNIERGYNVALWEVGDEQWGTWAKGHAPPDVYARKYITFVKAMRAVDPTIKVATNVPLGPHSENWTTRVMQEAGEYVDVLTYTFFPQKWGMENDDTLLATVGEFRTLITDLRKEVESVVGKKRASEIVFVNVGYNSVNHSPGPQTLELVNALWTADMLGTMAETGTDIGCFWALHNAFPPRKGDYGYLSSEGSNTPSFTYHVFPMLSSTFRGEIVKSTSSDPQVTVYSSRSEKQLTAVFLNKEKTDAKKITVELKGFRPRASGTAWILDQTRRNEPLSPVPGFAAQFTLHLPPFSLVVLSLVSQDSALPPANLALKAKATASSVSLIGPHFGPHQAIDGLPYTRWNSAAWTKSDGLEEQWFQLQWDTPQRIGRITLRWGESRARDFSVLASPDGSAWMTVHTVANGTGNVDTIEMNLPSVRFLKIAGTRGSKGISAYSLREVEVY